MAVTYDHQSDTTVGRISVNLYDFLRHIDGTDFRQRAHTVDVNEPLANLGGATTVQEALDYINLNGGGGGGGVSFPINLSTLGNTSGILPIVRGGTGLNTIGAANFVLTSNGSAAIWTSVANANISVSAAIDVSKLAAGADGQVLQISGGVPVWSSPPAGTPGGSSPQVQFNNGGIFGGAANVTYTSNKLRLASNLQYINSTITGDLAWTPTSTNKTLTLPDATDTIVARATTDTLTNKTFDVANNTLTSTSIATGDVLLSNGTKFVRQAKGTDGQFLGVSGGVVGYYTPAGGGGGSPGGSNTQFQYNNAGAFGGASNVVYTGSKLQLASNLQFLNSTITGDLAWAPTSTNKTLTLPDATDTIVARNTADTLTNKTINIDGTTAANSLTSASITTGNILKSNGSRFASFSRGTSLQVLRVNSGGTDLEWATIGGAGSSGANSTVQLSDGSGGFIGATNVLGGSSFLSIGTSPALSGALRLPNDKSVSGRNVGNSGDLHLISLDNANQVRLDGNGTGVAIGSTVVATSGKIRTGYAATDVILATLDSSLTNREVISRNVANNLIFGPSSGLGYTTQLRGSTVTISATSGQAFFTDGLNIAMEAGGESIMTASNAVTTLYSNTSSVLLQGNGSYNYMAFGGVETWRSDAGNFQMNAIVGGNEAGTNPFRFKTRAITMSSGDGVVTNISSTTDLYTAPILEITLTGDAQILALPVKVGAIYFIKVISGAVSTFRIRKTPGSSGGVTISPAGGVSGVIVYYSVNLADYGVLATM